MFVFYTIALGRVPDVWNIQVSFLCLNFHVEALKTEVRAW